MRSFCLLAQGYHLVLGTHHPFWMLLLAAAVILLGLWSYRAQSATPRLKWTLAALRAAALLVVVFLLARPELVTHHLVRHPGRIAIWVDTSLSMTLRDDYPQGDAKLLHQILLETHRSHPTRFEIAVGLLRGAEPGWLGTALRHQQVVIYTGGSHPHLLGAASNLPQLKHLITQLSRIKPAADSTNIPQVIDGILGQLSGEPVSAVVLLSDGRTTEAVSARGVMAAIRRRALRVIAVPIGRDHLPFSIQLVQGSTPQQAFVGDPVPVRAHLHVTASPHALTRRVRLFEVGTDGKVLLASKTVHIPAGKSQASIRLTWRPRAPGRYHLSLVIRKAAGEFLPPIATWHHHSIKLHTRVIKSRIRVLYVDGYPRWEYRYLKNDLAREKTTLLSCLLLSADNHFAQAGNIPITRFPDTQSELDQYDVLILGDVDPNYFSANQMKIINHFVGDHGGGFAMIAGPDFAPSAYRGTPIARLLPIIIGNPSNPAMEPVSGAAFGLRLTAAGRRSMLFHFFSSEKANLRQVANLPRMYWYQPVAGLAPSATVLAMLAGRQITARDIPAIVMGRYGAGRTLFSAIEDTWRWRTYHGAPLYKSYWLETVRTLAQSRLFGHQRAVVLQTPSTHALVGQSVPVTLRINRTALQHSLPPQLSLNIDGPGGRAKLPLVTRSTDPGVYRGLIHLWAAGRYIVSPPAGELPSTCRPVTLTAQEPQTEFINPRADPAAMAALAKAARGKLIRPQAFAAAGRYVPDRSVETLLTDARELWNKPWALAVMVMLLTGEWLLRKRAGLI